MVKREKYIEIFTDGACSGNPGPGGWGAILRYPTHEKELSGFSEHTTNNRMELLAAIGALEELHTPFIVDLTTDSTYVKEGMTKWIVAWKKRGWKKATGKPIKNDDLWKRLDAVASKHTIRCHWVRGHTGHIENERADQLATAAIKNGLL